MLEIGRAQRREEAETDPHQQQTTGGKNKEPQIENRMESRPAPPACELRDGPSDP